MELKSRFFESPAWLKPRRFSPPEALIDMVGAHEAGIVKGEARDFFSLRWSWAPDEFDRFIDNVQKSGWWNPKRDRLGRSAIQNGLVQAPPLADREMVDRLHKAYNQSFGRRLKLTNTRTKAYSRLWTAGLKKESDPLGKFHKLCETVQSRDFYMGDPRLHAPESLFRNHERCETWLDEAAGGKTISPDQARERKKAMGFVKPTPATEVAPTPVDVDALYGAMSDEQQTRLQAEFLERRKRLKGLTRFRATMEQAVWAEIVTREAR